MNEETALDPHTRVAVSEAHMELEKHGLHGMVVGDELHAAPEGTDHWERVCIVYRGEIKSRALMLFLGY